jgi:RHS repeat-associated protein
VTNSAGAIVSTIELDPWGADTNRSNNAAFQPRKFTSYERDANGSDEAMFRRYNRWQSRFDQPDPYDGSYDAADPQSFNRYAYVQGDPVNFVDPTGLDDIDIVSIWIWDGMNPAGGGGDREFLGANPHADDPRKPWHPERPEPQQTTQQQQPQPCSEQDLNFSEGSGRYTANELSAIAQTALGEASNFYAVGEVSALVATIYNRLNINQIYVNQSAGYTPFRGATSVMGVLGDYQAHWDRTTRPDGLRSGEGKLADARVNGVLPANSYVCDQVMAAKTQARTLGATDANALFTQLPYTWNLGRGVPLPRDAFGVQQIGNTRFFNRPFR